MEHSIRSQNSSCFKHDKQSGIYTILNVFIVSMAISGLMVLVVGQIAWEKGKIQGLADMVALTAARELGDGPIFPAAHQIATQNGLQSGDQLTIECTINDNVTTDCQHAITARVTITRTVNPVLGFIGPKIITRLAEATTAPTVVGYASSGLLNLNTQQSALLNGLLSALGGGNINLSVAQYGALLGSNINVNLLDLAVQLGVANVSQLLDLKVSALGLLKDSLIVGNGDAASVSNITGILSALSVPLNQVNLKVGDLIAADLTGKSQSVLSVNLGNLAQVALLKSVEGQTYTIPITVGLLGVSAAVNILQAPQIFVGQKDPNKPYVAQGHTAQVAVSLRVNQLLPNINIPGLLSLSVLNLSLQLKVAGGSVQVDNLTCNFPRSDNTLQMTVVPSLLDLCIADSASNLNSTTQGLTCGNPAQILDLTLLSFIHIAVDLSAQASLRSDPVHSTFTGVPPFTQTISLPLSQTLANLLSNLKLNIKLDIPLIGDFLSFLINGLLSFLLLILDPILRPILFTVGAILDGLLQLLGISLNQVTVFINHIDCQSVYLTK